MSNTELPATDKPPFWPQAKRGLAGRCPHCGKGKLFRSYLKQVDDCSACGEHFGTIRADDGPAWLTILAVGHIVVPLVVEFERDPVWPAWVSMVLWPSLALVLALVLLPLAKGLFITILWRGRKFKAA